MRRGAIILLVIMLSAPCPALTLGELADILEAMESAVEDVTIEYEWYNQKELTEQDVNDPGFLVPVSRAACTFTTAKPFTELQAYSEKVDLSQGPGRTFTSDSHYTYNGKLFRQLSSGGLQISQQMGISESGARPAEGFITRRTDLLRAWNSTPMAFTIFRFYPRGLLSQMLREHPEWFRIVDGIQQVRDFHTIELDCVTDTRALHQRVFLSVDHGYTPVRFEYICPFDGSRGIEVDVLALREVSPNLWFPVKGTTTFPDDNDGDVYEASSVTLNQNLSKDDFNLAFPPGTEVNDETAWWPKINLAILSPGEVAGVLLLLVALAVLVLYRTVRRRSLS
ncbi:MAG: hypothetical protein JSW27_24970 [Phycisphaerales bacterium]|nr:MAG: hypothetical protein JSW27_24970 [Phycisphaerales bacterium]